MTAQLETPPVLEAEREISLHEPALEPLAPRLFPAVPAGAASGLAILALVQFLGRGLALVTPPGDSGELTFGSIVWWLIAVTPAAAAAGILAGALARPVGNALTATVGLVTWAAGMIAMAVLLGIGAANLLGGVPSFLSGYTRFPTEVRYGEFSPVAAWVVLASAILGLTSAIVGAMIGARAKTARA